MSLERLLSGQQFNTRALGKLGGQRRRALPISNDNVSAPPTDAELDTAFGDAATLPNGFAGLVNDNAGGLTVYICYVVGDKWWYEQLAQAT